MEYAEEELFARYHCRRHNKGQIINSAVEGRAGIPAPLQEDELINGFSSYDGFFSIFFYAYALQSYDAFFFYHKAYKPMI